MAEMMIDSDMPCVQCGYNLRGLRHGGRCPECGLAVQYSLARGPFRALDLEFVARRVRLLFWLGLARSATVTAAALTLHTGGELVIPKALFMAFGTLTVARSIATAMLALEITSYSNIDPQVNAAGALLGAELLRGCAAIASISLLVVSIAFSGLVWPFDWIVYFACMCTPLLDVVCFVLWHRMGSTIAMRLGDLQLAGGSRVASVVGGVLSILLAAAFCAGPFLAMILHHVYVFRLMRALEIAVICGAQPGRLAEDSP